MCVCVCVLRGNYKKSSLGRSHVSDRSLFKCRGGGGGGGEQEISICHANFGSPPHPNKM